ncbi:hypothetical protein ABZP36_021361 [Zizania latifolia]
MAVDDGEDDQLASMSTDDIVRASHLLNNETSILKASRPCCPLYLSPNRRSLSSKAFLDELQQTNLELESSKEKIKENQEKIKFNKQLPYLVGNVVKRGTIRYELLLVPFILVLLHIVL